MSDHTSTAADTATVPTIDGPAIEATSSPSSASSSSSFTLLSSTKTITTTAASPTADDYAAPLPPPPIPPRPPATAPATSTYDAGDDAGGDELDSLLAAHVSLPTAPPRTDGAAAVYVGFSPLSERPTWITYIAVPKGVPQYEGRSAFLLVFWPTETTSYQIVPSSFKDPKLTKPFERDISSISADPTATQAERAREWISRHPVDELEHIGYTTKRPEELKEFTLSWRKGTLKYQTFWDNNSGFVEAASDFVLTEANWQPAVIALSAGKTAAVENMRLTQVIRSRTNTMAAYQKTGAPLPSRYSKLQRRDSIISMTINNEGRVDLDIDPNTYSPRTEEDVLPSLVPRRSLLASGQFSKAIPRLNIVIQIVGSRGDVQPFIGLGKELKAYGHRVRLATHATFRQFVEENGIEFYPLGGDPNELMAYMVKNPGLLPGLSSIRAGDIGRKRDMIEVILKTAWQSCTEADPDRADAEPFLADAIISNPVSFAHIHCAEALHIPCHIFFTMPWSPTKAFPNPLTNVSYVSSTTNYYSYELVDVLTWEGLGDIINNFRKKTLSLPKLSPTAGPLILKSLEVPHTYIWSEALIPKPADWGPHIDITGFIFLDLASSYTPPQDLQDFLAKGEPPVYIGFGSIVVEDPDGLTALIFEAVKLAGVRAIVSKGWGGLGGDKLTVPDNVYMIGNCPHDWLFQQVSAVVHHGGAGTTSAGLRAGRPTVIVPFFGDQSFWGAMVASIQAGPAPIPFKKLTAARLSEAIRFCAAPQVKEAAAKASARIVTENGSVEAAKSFHAQLPLETIRCDVDPYAKAEFYVEEIGKKVSRRALNALVASRAIDPARVVPYRYRYWDSGSASLTRSLFPVRAAMTIARPVSPNPGPQPQPSTPPPQQQQLQHHPTQPGLSASASFGSAVSGGGGAVPVAHTPASPSYIKAASTSLTGAATTITSALQPHLYTIQRETGYWTAKLGHAIASSVKSSGGGSNNGSLGSLGGGGGAGPGVAHSSSMQSLFGGGGAAASTGGVAPSASFGSSSSSLHAPTPQTAAGGSEYGVLSSSQHTLSKKKSGMMNVVTDNVQALGEKIAGMGQYIEGHANARAGRPPSSMGGAAAGGGGVYGAGQRQQQQQQQPSATQEQDFCLLALEVPVEASALQVPAAAVTTTAAAAAGTGKTTVYALLPAKATVVTEPGVPLYHYSLPAQDLGGEMSEAQMAEVVSKTLAMRV
ncbi:hypothetical protein DFJ73DRAFT_801603 [Zopfochytrium polystomum]|nr:hypothetical protein DFJ73DRAFT_801603 [Zopfochytrium polystomum]